MGAQTFVNTARRRNYADRQTAFDTLVEDSREESGRSYSGEIGMKTSVKTATTAKACATLGEACEEAERLLGEEDAKYGDKWGPAWSIEVDGPEGGWVFFGWASS